MWEKVDVGCDEDDDEEEAAPPVDGWSLESRIPAL